MSRKNRPLEKKARAMERAIRKGRIPTKINLVEWLMDRSHAQTKGEAVLLIQAGAVRSESHTLDGKHTITREVPEELRDPETGQPEVVSVDVFSTLYPSSLRNTITFAG